MRGIIGYSCVEESREALFAKVRLDWPHEVDHSAIAGVEHGHALASRGKVLLVAARHEVIPGQFGFRHSQTVRRVGTGPKDTDLEVML
jgi:hypothetical protein